MPTITTCATGGCAAPAAGGYAASSAGATTADSTEQAAARHAQPDALLTGQRYPGGAGQPAQMFWLAVRAWSLTEVPPGRALGLAVIAERGEDLAVLRLRPQHVRDVAGDDLAAGEVRQREEGDLVRRQAAQGLPEVIQPGDAAKLAVDGQRAGGRVQEPVDRERVEQLALNAVDQRRHERLLAADPLQVA